MKKTNKPLLVTSILATVFLLGWVGVFVALIIMNAPAFWEMIWSLVLASFTFVAPLWMSIALIATLAVGLILMIVWIAVAASHHKGAKALLGILFLLAFVPVALTVVGL